MRVRAWVPEWIGAEHKGRHQAGARLLTRHRRPQMPGVPGGPNQQKETRVRLEPSCSPSTSDPKTLSLPGVPRAVSAESSRVTESSYHVNDT
ncbi:hypothetical protein NDU88_003091 [Pleurodeles waltl]|uniref:Uncharacterized protein n=1 Tax=Pleurodeles waltl TaxID=8319 RepID=A0AAV7M581_PLEWA|nr:hypothetical protein NDU88_003091 [Pleurodeles waltl]